MLTVRACVATERRASRRRRGEEDEEAEPGSRAFIAAIEPNALVVDVEDEEGEEQGKAEETATLRAARREPSVHLAAAEVARAGIVDWLFWSRERGESVFEGKREEEVLQKAEK